MFAKDWVVWFFDALLKKAVLERFVMVSSDGWLMKIRSYLWLDVPS